MQDAKANLALLKVVVFDDDGSSLEFKNVTADIEVPNSCVFVLENEAGVNGAGIGLISVGVVSRILGAIFEGFSKTIFAGPVEMDAGIHGYVHGTIHQNKLHVVGKLFTGLGEILMPVGVTATNKVKFCRIEQRQADVLLNQETILANQDDLLLGQWRTLCAFKHNLPDQCAEFVGNGFGNRGSKFENLH